MVVRSERIEFLQIEKEFRRDVTEINLRVNVDCRIRLLRKDMPGNVFFKTAGKFRNILHFHRKPGSIGMPSEVLEQVAAIFDSLVDIESRNGARRARSHVARPCQHDGRTIINLRQPRRHNADNPLVPRFIENDNRSPLRQIRQTVLSLFPYHVYFEVYKSSPHPLADKFGIALYKADDAVMVFGIGITYTSALYHLECCQ